MSQRSLPLSPPCLSSTCLQTCMLSAKAASGQSDLYVDIQQCLEEAVQDRFMVQNSVRILLEQVAKQQCFGATLHSQNHLVNPTEDFQSPGCHGLDGGNALHEKGAVLHFSPEPRAILVKTGTCAQIQVRRWGPTGPGPDPTPRPSI